MSEQNTNQTKETSAVSNIPIYKALVCAQSEFKNIPKNRENGAYKGSKYADLEAILQTVRPVLNKHGVFLYQDVKSDGSCVTVETVLVHESGGELRSGTLILPVGARTAQAVGSAITYGRRYSLCGFLGVSADDDDDGNAASGVQVSRNINSRNPPKTNPAAIRKPEPQPKPVPNHGQTTSATKNDGWPDSDDDWVKEFAFRIEEAESMDQLNSIGASIKAAGLSDSARTKLTTLWKTRRESLMHQ